MAQHIVGDTVSWASQAGGNWVSKIGKIKAIVLSGIDATAYLEQGEKASLQAQPTATKDRYLIQVDRKGKNGPLDSYFYAPLVSVIDKANPVESVPVVATGEDVDRLRRIADAEDASLSVGVGGYVATEIKPEYMSIATTVPRESVLKSARLAAQRSVAKLRASGDRRIYLAQKKVEKQKRLGRTGQDIPAHVLLSFPRPSPFTSRIPGYSLSQVARGYRKHGSEIVNIIDREALAWRRSGQYQLRNRSVKGRA